MREVLLVRHGQAVADAPGGDAARPLTDEGRAGVTAVARALAAFGFRPDALWHSPYVRAVQTAELLTASLGPRTLSAEGGLTPSSPAGPVAQAIFRSSSRCLVVVSHMPLLPQLAAELVGAQLEFGTATVAHVAVLGPRASVLLGLWSAEKLARVR